MLLSEDSRNHLISRQQLLVKVVLTCIELWGGLFKKTSQS